MVKIVLIVMAAIVVIAVVPLVVGSPLPREHSSSVTRSFDASADQIFALISTPAQYPSWRPEVSKIEMLSEEPLRFREHSSYGVITFEEVERRAPERLVIRIADDDLGFGGQWTYEINGSDLTITEDGFVSNPYMRFISKMMGHSKTIEQYLGNAAVGLADVVVSRAQLDGGAVHTSA